MMKYDPVANFAQQSIVILVDQFERDLRGQAELGKELNARLYNKDFGSNKRKKDMFTIGFLYLD